MQNQDALKQSTVVKCFKTLTGKRKQREEDKIDTDNEVLTRCIMGQKVCNIFATCMVEMNDQYFLQF